LILIVVSLILKTLTDDTTTGRKFGMTRTFYIFLFSIVFTIGSNIHAQGISRSTGIGWRIGAYSKNLGQLSFYFSGTGESKYSGSSFLYFYTRFKNHWYWEFNIGAVGHATVKSSSIEESEVTALVPMIIGLRNDYIASKNPGKVQPYYSFGLGAYFVALETRRYDTQFNETSLKLGIYGGTGVNVAFTSWFAFNIDLKYHIINLSVVNPANGFNLNFGLSLMWGRKSEMFRIRETKLIITDIYPAYYQFYNLYPLALVNVHNTSGYPIEVNLKSKVSPFSSRPKDSGFIQIEKGESKDLPATVIFDRNITQVSSREPAILDIEVEGRARTTLVKNTSAQIIVHTRNAWNGEVDKLGFFVTPDDQEIISLSRSCIQAVNDTVLDIVKPFENARVIFNELTRREIRYQSDPNVPYYKDDRVQFAMETLEIKTGDCDDLVVLYTSLLQSLGIKTAFIQVRDPENSLAHLFMMFDTGIQVESATSITTNEKRYVIREDARGEKTLWIPVETTLLAHGFEEAWQKGALNYLKDTTIRDGLTEGWVQIVDLN
jgi:hypothetical protein